MASKYFTFKELTATTTGLSNVPDWASIENLKTLASVLDQVRADYGKPIRVNCAYRSAEVNAKVGGVATSAHLKGLAADICAWSGTEADNRALLKVLEGNIHRYDQVISYHKTAGDKTATIRFIHVGLCTGVPRMQRLYK